MRQGQVCFYRDYDNQRVNLLTIEITEMNFTFPNTKIYICTHPIPETSKIKRLLQELQFAFLQIFDTSFYCDPVYCSSATKTLAQIMQVILQLLDTMPKHCLGGNVSSYLNKKITENQIQEEEISLHQFGFQTFKNINIDTAINRLELICAEFQEIGALDDLGIKIEIEVK